MITTTSTTATFLDNKPAKIQAPSVLTLPFGRQRQRPRSTRRRQPPTSTPSSTITVKPETEMPFVQDDPGVQSEELGDDSLLISYNPRTGRPIRQSAGKISRNSDYIDSSRVKDVEDDEIDHEDDDVSSSDGDDTLVDDAMEPAFDPEELAKMKSITKKRKRSPSPSPAVLSPEPSCEVTPLSSRPGSPLPGVMNLNSGSSSPSSMSTSTFNINLNIPLGFSGLLPIQLTIDHADGRPCLKRKRSDLTETSNVALSRAIPTSDRTTGSKTGFLSLSAELRNQIYRLVFVAPKDIHIARCQNVQRSAAFLRTCKQVYEEGRSILYSENTFEAERNKSIRTQMWNPTQSEYGYLQLHTWIGRMSPSTRSMIRNLRIDLDDALPSTTPRSTSEERRYVHEKHLIETFRLLGQDGKLRKITLAFGGRRHLQKTDHRFMKYLCAVKADYVEINHINCGHYSSSHWHRISWQAEDEVKRGMVRKKKLYPVDASTDSRKQRFATCKYCDGNSSWL